MSGTRKRRKLALMSANGFIETDSRVRGQRIATWGVRGVAMGDPGAVDEIDLARKAFDVPRFE